MTESILYAGLSMLGIVLVFATGLVIANVKLAVFVDPKQAAIERALPGANCGNCGVPGCGQYAKAVFEGTLPMTKCSVGGPSVVTQIAAILGVEAKETYPYRPVIHCGAKLSDRLQLGHYTGEQTCVSANVVGGVMGCVYGCLGLGDCVRSCEYDAMRMEDGLPIIDYEKCIGCGACVRACPRQIIEQIPFKVERMMVVACNNHDPAKAVREVCKVGCIGCGACARLLPEIFAMKDNLAAIDYEKLTAEIDFGPAVAKCPMDSMVYFGKPLPQYEEQLAGVEGSGAAAKPSKPDTTAEDLAWRG